jgi:L-ascorbate metabolism protein UlaG (beta-lactamase superfamily)
MQMEKAIKIIVVANCGLLVVSPEAKVLIDGIYQLGILDKAEHLFSSISEEVMDQIINGQGEFGNIDCLLFTHCHYDHFSGVKTGECIGENNISSILLPEDESPEVIALKDQGAKSGTEFVTMASPLGIVKEYIIEDISIKYFKSLHCGKNLSQVKHYCFLLTINDKKIYISGDADFTNNYQKDMLRDEVISLAFFNPLSFNHKSGHNLINNLNPEKAIMYHVPFEKDDRKGFRRVSGKSINRFSESLPPCKIISK